MRWYPEYHRWWFLPIHRLGRRPDPLRRRQARLTLLAWALVLEIISLQLLRRPFPDSGGRDRRRIRSRCPSLLRRSQVDHRSWRSCGDRKLDLCDERHDRGVFVAERSRVLEVNPTPIIICPLLLTASASSEAETSVYSKPSSPSTSSRVRFRTCEGTTSVVVVDSVTEAEVRQSSSSSPCSAPSSTYVRKLSMTNFNRLKVGDRRRLDDNRRGGVDVGVLGGGGYRRSGHAIGDVLGLYRSFTDPASAVI